MLDVFHRHIYLGCAFVSVYRADLQQHGIGEVFGWMKKVGGMRRPMRRGTDRVERSFTFAATAYISNGVESWL